MGQTVQEKINTLLNADFDKQLLEIKPDKTVKLVGFWGRVFRSLQRVFGIDSYKDCRLSDISGRIRDVLDDCLPILTEETKAKLEIKLGEISTHLNSDQNLEKYNEIYVAFCSRHK